MAQASLASPLPRPPTPGALGKASSSLPFGFLITLWEEN